MKIAVVIPVRQGGSASTTLESLGKQTLKPYAVCIQMDYTAGGNANRTRNQCLETALLYEPDYVLFSDDDIDWKPEALATMAATLDVCPAASYSYCGYEMEGRIQCTRPFDAGLLRRQNYISTMSMIRVQDLGSTRFDESIRRLQDWDLWLTLLEQGKVGVYCGKVLFSTKRREGITYSPNSISYEEAYQAIMAKHRRAP